MLRHEILRTLRFLSQYIGLSLVMSLCPVYGQRQLPDKPPSPTPAIEMTGQLGSMTGSVTDPSGAVVSGVVIKGINKDTGASFTITTGPDGSFSVSRLTPGAYHIVVTAKGYRNEERDIELTPGMSGSLQFLLESVPEGEPSPVKNPTKPSPPPHKPAETKPSEQETGSQEAPKAEKTKNEKKGKAAKAKKEKKATKEKRGESPDEPPK